MSTRPIIDFVDAINKKTMGLVSNEYALGEELTRAERAVIDSIAERIRDKRILDLGVGAGRTVMALRQISKDYIGVDYTQKMVDKCRERFPGVRFEFADARSMSQFENQSFDLIFFSCNGISMVNHEGRIAILKEVHRLLRPDGFFIFSTYNQNSPEHDELFRFPRLTFTLNPAKLLVRGVRFLVTLSMCILNRMRYKGLEIRNDEYSIINDKCHNYRTMLYYLTLENQRKQLEKIGFSSEVRAYDKLGKLIVDDTKDDSIIFLVKAES